MAQEIDYDKWPDGACRTGTLEDIIAIIEDCRQLSRMGLVIGATGVGKSTAILQAMARLRHWRGQRDGYSPNLFYVSGSAATQDKPRLFLEALSETMLSQQQVYAFAPHSLRAVLGTLEGQGGKSVIVVDEAQKLGRDCLEILREIYDGTNVGVVMIGNERFRGKFKHESEAPYAHISSRITLRLPRIDAVPDADLEAICRFNDVGEPDAIAVLKPYSVGAGGLRHVVGVIDYAKERFTDGRTPDAAALRNAALAMGISS